MQVTCTDWGLNSFFTLLFFGVALNLSCRNNVFNHMIIKCEEADFDEIYEIINDAAIAYKGIIPDDCWHEPYMSKDELNLQLSEGVEFWKWNSDGKIGGVMGIQDKGDVTLIRHAYVRTSCRNQGIGTNLLKSLLEKTHKPVLIGTWADARWAIAFYQKHGFGLLKEEEKNRLLKKYWRISRRQTETSVVLADAIWLNQNS
jgi:N-acetylglutamate synthase-like GNAT family acetyltransferase